MANKEKETSKVEEQIVYFKLGKKQAKFVTQDNEIDLSLFTGKVTGEVSTKSVNYKQIAYAIRSGILEPLKSKPVAGKAVKAKEVDITSLQDELAEQNTKAITLLKGTEKKALLEKIPTMKNINLVVRLIENESRGKNISKRKRDDVIEALKIRLESLKKELSTTGMVETTEEGAAYKVKKEDDGF
jgi:hypothetical protein